jgi:hypothetical protein
MKTVVNIVNMVPSIMDVPGEYIRCSVSGEFRRPSEFCNDAGKQDRTNCIGTYLLPSGEFAKMKESLRLCLLSSKYKSLTKKLEKEQDYARESNLIDDVIAMLQGLKEKEPNCRIMISQAGYYADGNFAQLYGEPDLDGEMMDGTKVFSIGHSNQSC